TKGTRMGPQHLVALSMAGVASIEVYARPRVVIISTGNELVSFDSSEPLEYQIRNSTAPLLVAALKACGVSIEFQGIVADDAEQLERALLTAIEQRPDIIITTGGVSVGKFDLVESAFSKLGGKVHFHKAAVRPGKPILFGEFAGYEFTGKGPTFFGLAGNPLAVAAAIRFFVKPYLCALFGEGPEKPQRLPLTEDVQKPAGLSFFQGGVRDGQGVKALSGQASFMAASFLKAEGWIVGQPELARINAGDLVEWYPLW
ncbi:MAG: molybdopterin molybdenumtransferase MoeA, partial [Proteobacteria bacterium]